MTQERLSLIGKMSKFEKTHIDFNPPMFCLTKPLDILDLHIRYDYYEIHIMSGNFNVRKNLKKKKKKINNL